MYIRSAPRTVSGPLLRAPIPPPGLTPGPRLKSAPAPQCSQTPQWLRGAGRCGQGRHHIANAGQGAWSHPVHVSTRWNSWRGTCPKKKQCFCGEALRPHPLDVLPLPKRAESVVSHYRFPSCWHKKLDCPARYWLCDPILVADTFLTWEKKCLQSDSHRAIIHFVLEACPTCVRSSIG